MRGARGTHAAATASHNNNNNNSLNSAPATHSLFPSATATLDEDAEHDIKAEEVVSDSDSSSLLFDEYEDDEDSLWQHVENSGVESSCQGDNGHSVVEGQHPLEAAHYTQLLNAANHRYLAGSGNGNVSVSQSTSAVIGVSLSGAGCSSSGDTTGALGGAADLQSCSGAAVSSGGGHLGDDDEETGSGAGNGVRGHYSCPAPGCTRLFSSKFKLMRHTLIHGGERRFRCPSCDRRFHRKDHLKTHLEIHNPNKALHCCQQCGKTYSSSLSFRKHIALHAAQSGDPTCRLCGKSFSRREEVMMHLKVHSGTRVVKRPTERKFKCDRCERCFFTRKDVKRHMVVHTGQRNFVCQFCPQKFGRKDHLVRHTKKTHANATTPLSDPGVSSTTSGLSMMPPSPSSLNNNNDVSSLKPSVGISLQSQQQQQTHIFVAVDSSTPEQPVICSLDHAEPQPLQHHMVEQGGQPSQQDILAQQQSIKTEPWSAFLSPSFLEEDQNPPAPIRPIKVTPSQLQEPPCSSPSQPYFTLMPFLPTAQAQPSPHHYYAPHGHNPPSGAVMTTSGVMTTNGAAAMTATTQLHHLTPLSTQQHLLPSPHHHHAAHPHHHHHHHLQQAIVTEQQNAAAMAAAAGLPHFSQAFQ